MYLIRYALQDQGSRSSSERAWRASEHQPDGSLQAHGQDRSLDRVWSPGQDVAARWFFTPARVHLPCRMHWYRSCKPSAMDPPFKIPQF